jgi:AhpD family alkylhydroperoxidase
MHEPRINYYKAWPEGVKAQMALGHEVNQSGLEHSLLELIKLRASQINGCAFCIDMHSKDAMAAGETTQRLFGLDAWREAPFYTPRERAALLWTESITNITQGHAPDAAYNEVRAHFSEEETVKLTYAITVINSWNRLAIAFRPVVGNYQPAAQTTAPTT